MRIIDAIERKPLTIPIKEVMTVDGDFAFVAEVREKGYFDIDYRKNELVVIAGNYIGQIPLTDAITIHVVPKVPIANLARIVGIASQPIRCLDFFRRRYTLDGKASANLLEAMSRSLIASLRELDSEGVYREYTLRQGRRSNLRGRIDIAGYIRGSIATAQRTSIPCSFYELSIDTDFNRVIKRTIHELGIALSKMSKRDVVLVHQMEYFSDIFESVPLDRSSLLCQRARELLARRHIPELRAYYLDILDVCFIVLEGSGVELVDQSGPAGMHSFVVNMEDAFEQYLRTILSESDELKSELVTVLDGNLEGKSTLFSDNKTYSAKPDLIIKRAGTVELIGDVKYKSRLSEADRYQLIAHSLSYGADTAFFVTPAPDPENLGSTFVGTVGTSKPIRVYHYRINLDADDLIAEEMAFISWISDLKRNE